jgi:hypothetical protein
MQFTWSSISHQEYTSFIGGFVSPNGTITVIGLGPEGVILALAKSGLEVLVKRIQVGKKGMVPT